MGGGGGGGSGGGEACADDAAGLLASARDVRKSCRWAGVDLNTLTRSPSAPSSAGLPALLQHVRWRRH